MLYNGRTYVAASPELIINFQYIISANQVNRVYFPAKRRH